MTIRRENITYSVRENKEQNVFKTKQTCKIRQKTKWQNWSRQVN
jgi:hypothetical protein